MRNFNLWVCLFVCLCQSFWKEHFTFRDYKKSTTWFNKAEICCLAMLNRKRLFGFLAIVANQLKMFSESTHIFANGLAGELLCSDTRAGTWSPGTESWWNRTVRLLRILFKMPSMIEAEEDFASFSFFYELVHFDWGWNEKRFYIEWNSRCVLHMQFLIDSDVHTLAEFRPCTTPTYHHRKHRNNYADKRTFNRG